MFDNSLISFLLSQFQSLFHLLNSSYLVNCTVNGHSYHLTWFQALVSYIITMLIITFIVKGFQMSAGGENTDD